jgi:type IV secretion system protein VirB1
MDFLALAQTCAPDVHPTTMAAIMRVESGFNPFAIGVVNGRLARQPNNKGEAVATAKALEEAGYNFSLGAAQVNRHNLARFALTYETAFDPCESIRAGGGILKECYGRALKQFKDEQLALQASFSCYYSGNFSTGFKPDFAGQPSYVQKVLGSSERLSDSTGPRALAIPVIRTSEAKRAAKAVPSFQAGSAEENGGVISANSADGSSASVMVFQ